MQYIHIYMKHARHDASNYRGIHLTPQLSKVVERMIGVHLLPFLEKSGVYGPSQFAYRIGHGYRDALAYVTFNWVWALGLGKRVAAYCSDVSGAFDRVSAPKLLAKLSSAGVHPDLLKVLAAWLQERSANVCVDGCMSDSFALRNSVFQGTVLGPPLWNVFYGDARHAIHEVGFEECIFADDLNCFKVLAGSHGDNSAFNLLGRCQETLHKWGEANQVTFEPSKETMHVLDRYDPCGGSFKLLSVVFDGRLGMHEAVHHLCSEASWRLKTLLRTRRFYDCNSMLRLFKAQILSFLEGATPAIYHASPATLLQLDNIQTTFLEELGVTSEQALLEHNLAPLSMRRDFAMLAILYKVSRMTAPAPIQKLFFLGGFDSGCLRLYRREGPAQMASNGPDLPQPSRPNQTFNLRSCVCFQQLACTDGRGRNGQVISVSPAAFCKSRCTTGCAKLAHHVSPCSIIVH